MDNLKGIFLAMLMLSLAGMLNSELMAQKGGRGQGKGNRQSTLTNQRQPAVGKLGGNSQGQAGQSQRQQATVGTGELVTLMEL